MVKMLKGNKIHFTSLGCPRNLVDTEVMLGIVLKAGFEIIPDLGQADYLVVNTCGFLETARKESLGVIEELFSHRKSSAKIIVTGCMVRNHRDQLNEAFPEIDFILGSGDVESILDAIEASEKGEIVSSNRSYLQAGEIPRMLSTPKHYAYLKIAEGCRKRCAFCIIPKIKGPLQSKSVEKVVKEFEALLSQGVKEVILIAQDLGDFGKDIHDEKSQLNILLKELLKTEGDYWLRLLYIYPDEIDDELIDLMKQDSRLLPYLDMPIQHVNDRLLKLMRRKTSKAHITETISKLRKALPHVVIRTSLMVGFPTETEEEFQELVQFVKENPLDNIGVFQFSPEEGAKASSMEEQIPDSVKQDRYDLLMKTIQKQTFKRNQQLVGKTLDVIVEGYHPESQLLMVGRYYGQCPEIDGIVLINDTRGIDEFGKIYPVQIDQAIGYDLVGRVHTSLLKKLKKKQAKKKNPLALHTS